MPLSSVFPRAICFDLYGTLVDISIDTEPRRLWEVLCDELKQFGIHTDAVHLHTHYKRLVEAERSEHGQPFVLDNLFFFKLLNQNGAVLDRHTVHCFGRRFRTLTTRYIKVKPYARELLKALRARGCKLAIVSNTEETVTSHDLDELGLGNQVDAIVLSSAVGVKKPEPRIFHIALQKLGVLAPECVFIGDDYECDYLGPRRAGLRSLLLRDEARSDAQCVTPELRAIVDALESLSDTRSHCVYQAA